MTKFLSLFAAAALIAATCGIGVQAQTPDATPATKEQAVAMVQKAVSFIKAQGPDKGYAAIDDKDGDGKAFVKERVQLAKQNPSFWQSHKFMNPVTKQVEPKQMYCERLDETAVCGGIYQN